LLREPSEILIDMIIKFADDTKGLQEITCEADRDKLQSTLDRLVEWAKQWGMQFNVEKCKIMHIGNNPKYDYSMAGNRLAKVEEEKDVGITVSKNLKPTKHCKKAAGTAGAVLRQLARNFHYRDRNIFKKLYVQYVRPHLEFASPAWSPWHEADKSEIEKIQKKAVNMISGLENGSYEEKCTVLGLETLEARRKKQDLLEMYKVMKGHGQQDPGKRFALAQSREGPVTRQASDPLTIKVPRARLDIRKYSFNVRGAEMWNKLPYEVRALDSLPKFKNAIKKLPQDEWWRTAS